MSPIIDLHSDLLAYLAHKKNRSPYDLLSRSAHPQLASGNVALQTLAISAFTSSLSVKRANKQIDAFCSLINHYPQAFARYTKNSNLTSSGPGLAHTHRDSRIGILAKPALSRFAVGCKDGDAHTAEIPILEPRCVYIIPSIENASAFALEDEPLDICLDRLQKILERIGPLLYISLTWNGENRFGGGVGSTSGLKADGKELLHWLNEKAIAIDLSHSSDTLAYQILEHIDKNSLILPLIASHSNFRTITDVARNLPDEIAKELIRRKGLIGINLFAPFISKTNSAVLIQHIEQGLKIGGENALSFGADFFCTDDFPAMATKYPNQPYFFPEFANASAYPHLLDLLKKQLSLSDNLLRKISSGNCLRFLDVYTNNLKNRKYDKETP